MDRAEAHVVVRGPQRTFCSCRWSTTDEAAADAVTEHLRTAWPILVPQEQGETVRQWHGRLAEAHAEALEKRELLWQQHRMGQPIQPGQPFPVIPEDWAAKGLQADNIILAGMADQMVPGLTEDPALREEQRRLLYVAITRAKHELVISWSRQMSFRDARKNNVHEDQVRRTKGEEAIVLLSRSSLLPRNMQNVEAGEDWIEQR